MPTDTIRTNVAGVRFKNADGSSRQQHIRRYCAAFTPLILRREPDNRHDKNTVAVWVAVLKFGFVRSEVQIGHLPRELAADIAHHIDHGGTVTGEIIEIAGNSRDGPDVAVSIELRKR